MYIYIYIYIFIYLFMKCIKMKNVRSLEEDFICFFYLCTFHIIRFIPSFSQIYIYIYIYIHTHTNVPIYAYYSFSIFVNIHIRMQILVCTQCNKHWLWGKQYHNVFYSSRNLETACCTAWMHIRSTNIKISECFGVNLRRVQRILKELDESNGD